MTQDHFHCRYCESDLAHRDNVASGDELTCDECDAVYEVFDDHAEHGAPQIDLSCKACLTTSTVDLEAGETTAVVTCPDCGTDHSFRDDEVAVNGERGHPKFVEAIRLTKRPREAL